MEDNDNRETGWHRYCIIHDRMEARYGYLLCFECGHMYKTRLGLLWAHVRCQVSHRVLPIKLSRPKNIVFCPLCLHDF